MFKYNFSKLITIAVCFLGGIALFYTFYKAYNNSFTHDESYTYNFYVNSSIWSIINNEGPDIPNNHILNTLLMKLFQCLFSSSEFALRLPNLLAHLAFMFFTFKWLKTFNNPIVLLTGFVALNLNPYLLDFFALARGYGLSISFMFISFYFFYKYIFSLNWKDNLISFLCAALAVWSNFTLLNYFLSLFIIFNIYSLQRILGKDYGLIQKLKDIFISNIPSISISVLLIILILKPLETIKGSLFGPEDGFYTNTMRSIVFCSTYGKFGNAITAGCVFLFIIALLSLAFYGYDLLKSKCALQKSPHLLILLFAALPAFSTMIQNSLFNTQFLESRTGLFFIVLFNINFIYLFYFLFSKFRKTVLLSIIALIYPSLLLYNFIYNYRLSYYADWAYDAGTKKMLILLNEDRLHAPKIKPKVSLGITWLFEPSIAFYKKTKNLDWLEDVNQKNNNGNLDYYYENFDYYYVHDNSDFIEKQKKVILMEIKESNTILAKNR